MTQSHQDERIAKRTTSSSEVRADRAMSDRPVTENRDHTDTLRNEELFAMVRDVNTKLPSPPQIPGYHMCWLTTTNQSDPIEHRLRIGYQLVKQSELPGFVLPTQQSGQVSDDHIRVNEMVLSKIDIGRWELIMKHLHHDLPREQMENLRQSVRITRDERGRDIAYTGGEFRQSVSEGFDLSGNPVDRFGKQIPANFAGVA